MSIKYKIYQNEYPYHVYNRVNNKEHLFKLGDTFPIFLDVLEKTAKTHNVLMHHFLLMENHYHLMLTTTLANLNKFMCTFQTHVSYRINQQLNRINHIFGNRYGATVIKTEIYITRLIKYIYQNPINSNSVTHPLDYPYSTLKFYVKGDVSKYGFVCDPYLEGISSHLRAKELLDLCEIDLDLEEHKLVEASFRCSLV